MIEIVDKKICTGCSACVSICPTRAIYFESDYEGFVYPKTDKDKCIKCKKCIKVCPTYNEYRSNNNENPDVYAGWNKNEEVRLNSTSGGVFTLLAQYILNNNGYVVAAEYRDDFSVYHTIISNLNDIKKQRQSKYLQSDINDVFVKIKKLLNEENLVLFCGTPCQNAGLKSYLGKEYENLFLCDFICRGVISPKVFKKYLIDIEEQYEQKITKVHFKHKLWGWNKFSTKIDLENNQVYQKNRDEDLYMVGYLKYNLYLRPCCYNCKFKNLPRQADLSLGDFWGIGDKDGKLDDNKGTSVVIVNSQKGNFLLNNICNNMVIKKQTVEDIVKGNACLFNSPNVGEFRSYFFKNFDKMSFTTLIEKIISKQNKAGIREYIKIIIKKFKLKIEGIIND